ncbi:hypothetical protein [Pseudomonas sp. microsymbiont 2]
MDKHVLMQQVETNIEYQLEKLKLLWGSKEQAQTQVLDEILKKGQATTYSETVNQALTDTVLNSMASLLDYYCIHCFLRMGGDSSTVTKIQYRPINNHLLRRKSQFKRGKHEVLTLAEVKARFDANVEALSGLRLEEIDLHNYWHCFFADVNSSLLFDVGLVEKPVFEFSYDEAEKAFEIDKVLCKYHCLMERFYCNAHFYGGVKYGIYIDLNNCLKHNIVPYTKPQLEYFAADGGTEGRAYFYFELANHDSVFLKPGLLKDIVDAEYDDVRASLIEKAEGLNNTTCALERDWEMPQIIRVDLQNGYIHEKEEKLFFMVDGVLMAKTRDKTYVDAAISFKQVLAALIRDVETGMQMDTSPFD